MMSTPVAAYSAAFVSLIPPAADIFIAGFMPLIFRASVINSFVGKDDVSGTIADAEQMGRQVAVRDILFHEPFDGAARKTGDHPYPFPGSLWLELYNDSP
jgi:hypothetical protein